MLVVSNLDLTTDSSVVKPSTFLDSMVKDTTLNVNNDYRYLKTGYFVSLHAEVMGNKVIPSCENIIDSSRTPILLLRATKAGIPTLPFLVTDSVKKIETEIGFPVMVFAVNPFIHEGFKTAKNKSAMYRSIKSLGMNYKFAVCVQPLKGDIITLKSLFGQCDCLSQDIQRICRNVYETFNIPVCKLHLQKTPENAFLCGLESLKKQELTSQDLKKISEEVMLISEQGEPILVQNRLLC